MRKWVKSAVAIIAAAALAACGSAEDEAKETFEGFIGVFDSGGFSEITEYITNDFAEREFGVSLEQIETDAEEIDEQMGEIVGTFSYTIVTFSIEEESEDQIEAAYELYIEERNGEEIEEDRSAYDSEELETGSVILVNEDGDWFVDDMNENP
ncbi:hypothetical protein CR205_10880 [Alteribacter lacisalsi]|uniref:DUF4878 domain-containing protein n=1 Tax=Alteribacter lacisalsi TaxID=2045244 RepID=A0A2W0HDP8_9BACI|nr:hypothetical protein [Alteribacter lacisalsi]PYZ99036.1 hypothetical protein CR205_10880 [Alteribacter lacisalsi]